MNTKHTAWELTDQVGHVHSLLGATIEDQVAPYGLTRAQAHALGVLTEFPLGISQAEWARMQGVSRQHAHAIARRLQNSDWIEGATVGRERIVALSESGIQKIEDLRPKLEESLEFDFSSLTKVERKELSRLLGKLIEAISAQSEIR